MALTEGDIQLNDDLNGQQIAQQLLSLQQHSGGHGSIITCLLSCFDHRCSGLLARHLALGHNIFVMCEGFVTKASTNLASKTYCKLTVSFHKSRSTSTKLINWLPKLAQHSQEPVHILLQLSYLQIDPDTLWQKAPMHAQKRMPQKVSAENTQV